MSLLEGAGFGHGELNSNECDTLCCTCGHISYKW